MNLNLLFLVVPGFLVIRTTLILFTWLKSSSAGLPGYLYERQADPGWYWVTVVGGTVLLATYAILCVFLYVAIQLPGFRWSSPINLVLIALLISQESGLKLRNQPPSA